MNKTTTDFAETKLLQIEKSLSQLEIEKESNKTPVQSNQKFGSTFSIYSPLKNQQLQKTYIPLKEQPNNLKIQSKSTIGDSLKSTEIPDITNIQVSVATSKDKMARKSAKIPANSYQMQENINFIKRVSDATLN